MDGLLVITPSPVGEGNHNKSSGSILSFDLFANLKLFELRLGVPENFYRDLLHEDDWSFVIKLNALFEAACTHILATRMHAPALEESLANLDLLHSKYGKVALLRKLGALTSEQGTVLRNLAELRNSLAHNIHNVAFSFEKYVAGLDKQQLDNLIRNFGHGVADELRIGDKTIQRRQFIHENPKIALWLTSVEILGCLAIEVEVARLHVKSLALSEFANLHGAQPRSLRSLDSQKLRAREWVG